MIEMSLFYDKHFLQYHITIYGNIQWLENQGKPR